LELANAISTVSAFDFNDLPLSVIPAMPLIDLALEPCSPPEQFELVAIDTCQNVGRCMTQVVITDITNPNILCPDPIDIYIGDNGHVDQVEAWEEEALIDDVCTDANFITDLDISRLNFNCDSFFIIPVEFIVSDECGNTSSCDSQINVTNELDPVVICDADLMVNCDADPEETIDELLIQFEEINSFDEDVTIPPDSVDIDLLIGLQCGDIVLLPYIVEDGCGRLADCISEITILDTVPPEIDFCPDVLIINDVTATTVDDIDDWLYTMEANDNCSVVDYSTSFDSTLYQNLCGWQDTLIVTFTAFDRCGNSSTCDGRLFVKGNLLTLSCPTTLTLECGDTDINTDVANWLQTASAEDQDGVIVAVDNDYLDLPVVIDCIGTTDVNFKVVNDCGTEESCMAVLTIEDTTSPELTCPTELSLLISEEDISDRIMDWIGQASATDLCGMVSVSSDFTLDLQDVQCDLDTIVPFVAVDECGLEASCSANLRIENDLSVVFTCPPDTVLICSQLDVEASIYDLIDEVIVDSNSQVDVSDDFDPSILDATCAEPLELVVTVSGQDFCQNTDDCSFFVNILPDGELYIPTVFSPSYI